VHPILFQAGVITVYTYGVLVATGVVLGLLYARRQAARMGLPPREVWNLGIYMIFSALIVSKLWLVFTNWDYYAANRSEILSVTLLQSGGTFYGGVLGAVLAILVYSRTRRWPLLPVFDISAGALPLAQANHDSLGRDVYGPGGRAAGGYTARRAASPDAALRSGG
jgi:phosphatidylglycerol:prolipoprotein diacylglycerol transferase